MIMESANENKQFEVAEIQLSYKSKMKASLRPEISCSKDAEKILRETWDSDKLGGSLPERKRVRPVINLRKNFK